MNERRLSPRAATPYPVRVKATDTDGQRFTEETLLENLSGGGSYFRLRHMLSKGEGVSLAVRLSTASDGERSALMAASGIVRRVEQQPDGAYGTAVQFRRRRIL